MYYYLRTESLCGVNREPVLKKASSEDSSSSHSWIFAGRGHQPGSLVQPGSVCSPLCSVVDARQGSFLFSMGESTGMLLLKPVFYAVQFSSSLRREQFHMILLWLLDLGMFSQFHTWTLKVNRDRNAEGNSHQQSHSFGIYEVPSPMLLPSLWSCRYHLHLHSVC